MKKILKTLSLLLLFVIMIVDFYNTITVIFEQKNLIFNLIGIDAKDIYFYTLSFKIMTYTGVILIVTLILLIFKNSFAAVVGFINVIIRLVFVVMICFKMNFTNINNLIYLGISLLVLIFYIVLFSICKKTNIETMREKRDRLIGKV